MTARAARTSARSLRHSCARLCLSFPRPSRTWRRGSSCSCRHRCRRRSERWLAPGPASSPPASRSVTFCCRRSRCPPPAPSSSSTSCPNACRSTFRRCSPRRLRSRGRSSPSRDACTRRAGWAPWATSWTARRAPGGRRPRQPPCRRSSRPTSRCRRRGWTRRPRAPPGPSLPRAAAAAGGYAGRRAALCRMSWCRSPRCSRSPASPRGGGSSGSGAPG
mmetsp:Transcript_41377/g.137582  ORF Transcript_41377/g.137582 Transcript_41377/m.137582 type:complete len:219 (+) Transcript_41377:334-990(+)